MGLIVSFDGGWDSQSKNVIEDILRKAIGAPPRDENWSVTLCLGFSQSYCEVRIVTPHQARTRLFLEEPSKLGVAIVNWINMYPLR